MRRHLGDQYRIHTLTFNDPCPVHIDCTFNIIGPGLVITNPELPCNELDMFRKAGWKIVTAPESVLTETEEYPLLMSTNWLSMNTLMIDEKRVLVEKGEIPTQKMFKKLGIECIKVSCIIYTLGTHRSIIVKHAN